MFSMFLKEQFSLNVSSPTKVARWIIFKPKNPTWLNFGGSGNGRCCYIVWPFGKFPV
jgi:hypothetical protein